MRGLCYSLNNCLNLIHRCRYSIGSKEFIEKTQLPATVLPSKEFLKALSSKYNDKIARLITEIEVILIYL